MQVQKTPRTNHGRHYPNSPATSFPDRLTPYSRYEARTCGDGLEENTPGQQRPEPGRGTDWGREVVRLVAHVRVRLVLKVLELIRRSVDNLLRGFFRLLVGLLFSLMYFLAIVVAAQSTAQFTPASATPTFKATKHHRKVGTDEIWTTIRFQNLTTERQALRCRVRVFIGPGNHVVDKKWSEVQFVEPRGSTKENTLFTITTINEDFTHWTLDSCIDVFGLW
jgi:hypothetical protein